ncbi:endonuclease V [Candidatus Bathyarchaeota archaeon]|nr:MAG: endonuclease V [Candidatus Bathyarchaeota archaeon]RLI31756.1 MAG: endonuclease V [Candidatus Bathyarchaeota archaeon]
MMKNLEENKLMIPEWFSLSKARKIQQEFAKKVVIKEISLKNVKTICGFDVAYKGEDAYVSAIILKFEDLSMLEFNVLKLPVKFPYIPTLLSFREAPLIFKAFSLLKIKPDVLMVEGHGLAHPYGCGLATHVGIVLKLPTIGVAKKLLCGFEGKFMDGKAKVIYNGRVVGYAVKVKSESKPIYVSVGNMLTLEDALKITCKCFKGGRLPEPLRLAHIYAEKYKRKNLKERV